MHADRIGRHAGQTAVHRLHHAFLHQPQHACRHHAGIVQHRARRTPRHQRPLRGIAPVGKRLGHHPQPGRPRPRRQRRARQHHQRQIRIQQPQRLDHIGSLPLVVRNGVVERAVRFYVAHLGPCHPGQRLQRADLVDHPRTQVCRGHIHRPPAKARQVRIGHVRAHTHTPLRRRPQRIQHPGRITRMETAGHIGTGDDIEHRRIVPHFPGTETLAQVTVQIDLLHVFVLRMKSLIITSNQISIVHLQVSQGRMSL